MSERANAGWHDVTACPQQSVRRRIGFARHAPVTLVGTRPHDLDWYGI